MYCHAARLRFMVITVILILVPAAVMAGDKGQAFTADTALNMLRDGNARFVSGRRGYPNLGPARLAETKNSQHPYASVLSCSDSRVPVEHIFDAGLGDIFVIRVAGNVSGINEIATIEYGTEHLHTPLLVVLGHTACGAVTAVTRGDKVGGSIPRLAEKISPAVDRAKKKEGHAFSEKLLDTAIRYNVWQSMEDLFRQSPIVKELVKERKLMVVGALYHLDNGTVEWMGEHPAQKTLLASSRRDVEGMGSGMMAPLIIAITSGIMVILFLAVYLQFFRERGGRKTSVMARLAAGFSVLILVAVIASSVNSWIAARAEGAQPWAVQAILPSLATALSIAFSCIFARSMSASFRRVIAGLKAMIKTNG